MSKINFTKIISIFIFAFFICNDLFAQNTYFDLSEKEIQIQTNFNGKEIIIFGIMQKGHDTVVSIKGPYKDTKVLKKERILGFWFNTKKVIFKQLPSLFFIASSSPITEILNQDTIIKEKLYFNELLTNTITQRNFIEQKNLSSWNKNLIDIKIANDLYKEYVIQNVDNKLFQTRVFFPTNSIPGEYQITTYQIKNKLISSKKNKVINIKKSGVGEKIFEFAHKEPASYGLLTILFAVLSGLIAATIFRRL